MILTIVPNPALDKTVVLPDFTVGKIYRAAEVLTLAGGKGFNFARALQTLGQRSLVVGPVGGHAGRRLLELAAQDGLACASLPVEAELRTCLTIVDPHTGKPPTEIYERGMPLRPGEWKRLVEQVADHFAEATFLAVCGSFLPGMPERGLYHLVQRAKAASLPVLLDTHGPQLISALELVPDLLKVNQVEVGELVGREVVTSSQALAAALELQKRGVREVVITLGKEGAVGLTAEGQYFGWVAPEISVVCPTGSGDSLFAGIVAGLAQGERLPEAVRLGVAAGAANTLQLGAGRLERQQVEQIWHTVRELAIDDAPSQKWREQV
jgi:1-phosphofructokinase family hexose kinase